MLHARIVVIGVFIFAIIDEACFINNDTNSEPEEVIELAHPAGITLSKIIVDCNDMNAATSKRIKVNWECCNESFTFTSLHLGNIAFVKHHTTDELNIEWTKFQNAITCFTNKREGFWKKLIEHLIIGSDLSFFINLLGLLDLFTLLFGSRFYLLGRSFSLSLLVKLVIFLFKNFSLLGKLFFTHLRVFRTELIDFIDTLPETM